MKTLTLQFDECPIHFEFFSEKKLMVNATEMARSYQKVPIEFLRLDSTKEFISTLIDSANTSFAQGFNMGFSHIETFSTSEDSPEVETKAPIFTEEDFVITVRGGRNSSGTWMHRHLAIEFAGWLDVRFKIWMIESIDTILLGNAAAVDAQGVDLEEVERLRQSNQLHEQRTTQRRGIRLRLGELEQQRKEFDQQRKRIGEEIKKLNDELADLDADDTPARFTQGELFA